jgi:hypothetical protein
LATTAPSPAADNTPGAVEQSGSNPVPQDPSPGKLHLSDAQRERIRQALATKATDVEFTAKTAQSAKDYTPKIGAKLPKGIKPHALPPDLARQVPDVADYGYSKIKGQILLMNEMTGEIAEIIPETQAQTTGQN